MAAPGTDPGSPCNSGTGSYSVAGSDAKPTEAAPGAAVGAGPTWQASGSGLATGAVNSAGMATTVTPPAPPPPPLDSDGGAEGCADLEGMGSPRTKHKRRSIPSVVGERPKDIELSSPFPFLHLQ